MKKSHIALITYKRIRKNSIIIPLFRSVGKTKKKKSKNKKKGVRNSNQTMVKKIPNFFDINTTEEVESEEEIESAYTELARMIFMEKLDGKSLNDNVYNQMTNDHKLRSVIRK